MKQALRLLAIMAAMMALMIMTASIALADHPDASHDGTNQAEDVAGGHSQPARSNGEGEGGLVGNPTGADIDAGAMEQQVAHNPLCGGHTDGHTE